MKKILSLVVLSAALLGCSQEKGDKPIARGKGFGYEWKGENQNAVLRVSVQNSFTRDSCVALEGNGAHYELCVSPIGEGYMIVPKGDYNYSAWSFGKSLGNTKFDVAKDDRNGISGVMIKVRP